LTDLSPQAGFSLRIGAELVIQMGGRGVVFKRMPQPAPTMEIAVVWRRNDLSEVLHAFLEAVR
jgi:DNA-binding transcriptional LysR family regulator